MRQSLLHYQYNTGPFLWQRVFLLLTATLLILISGFFCKIQDARGGTIDLVSSMGASSGITIYLTGTGFNATASYNEVTFTSSSGASATATATAVTTLDSATGLRRLTVKVPGGLPVGTTALSVLNKGTGEVSGGKSLEIIEIYLPEVTRGAPGTANLIVRITGSPNCKFVAGSTRATFGTGVTVNSTAVEFATSLLANITVSSSATLGTRTVGVITNTQMAVRADAFTIATPIVTNSPPLLASTANPVLDEGRALNVSISATDPDGDSIILATSTLPAFARFTDSGNGTGTLSLTPDFVHAGTYNITLTATDSKGATASSSLTITVREVNRTPSLSFIGGRSVSEGGLLNFQVSGTDPDGDMLEYVAGSIPFGATFDPPSRTFQYTPNFDISSRASDSFFDIFFEVRDGRGGTAGETVRITVIDVNRPPAITTTDIPSGRVDQAYNAGILASDADGDALAYSLSKGPTGMLIKPATGQLTWRPGISHIGEHHVGVRVEDGRGGEAIKEFTLRVPDTIPPGVSLNAPREAIPGASFIATVDASDNDGIASVTIYVDGQEPLELSAPPYQRDVVLPAVLSIGSSVGIKAVAKDLSGNTGEAVSSVVIIAAPDTTPPAVSLHAPSQVTHGGSCLLTGTVSDNTGVSQSTFYVNGNPIGSVPGSSPSITYSVPADAVPGSALLFSLEAEDFSGNRGRAEASAIVTDIPDTTPPQVILTTPQTATVGSSVTVSPETSDSSGVARVDVYVNHILVGSYTGTQTGAIDIDLPDGLTPGMDALVEVRVTDFSGNVATQSQSITIEGIKPPERGVVTGEVYNDATGLPIEGAEVIFIKTDGSMISGITDSRGRYSLVTEEGGGRLVISKDGFTRVDRPGIVITGSVGIEVFDARLTALQRISTISSVFGGILTTSFSPVVAGISLSSPPFSKGGEGGLSSSGNIELAIPSGALASDQAFTLTQISGQGLQGLLPPGWSPVAVADITPHGVKFNTPAVLTAPQLIPSPPFSGKDGEGQGEGGLLLARWDEAAAAWRAIAIIQPSTDAATISGEVAESGQYAFLLPDTIPQTPPVPSAGELLQGVLLRPVPQDVTTGISPQPKIIFYKPGVHSYVGLNITSPLTTLPSGTQVWSKITEEYNFYSGARITTEPYIQDIVLYNSIAGYPATPSYTFEPLTLEKGIITVEVVAPPEGQRQVSLIGPEGGTITTPTGESITVPPGAISDFIPVEIIPLSLTGAGITLPSGFNYAGGLSISFGGNILSLPASLSIPLSSSLTGTGQFLLVKVAEIQDATRLVLVGVARVEDGRIISIYDLSLLNSLVQGEDIALSSPPPQGEGQGGGGVNFAGILSSGRYILLHTDTAIGFAGGKVYGTEGTPFPGAVVSSDRLPIISFSFPSPSTGEGQGGGEPGRYISGIATGPFTLTALDTTKMDSGTASGTVPAAWSFINKDISLKAEPPKVVSIDPPDGRDNVPFSSPIRIQFSEPVDPSTITDVNISLSGPEGVITVSLNLSSNNTIATLRPSNPLIANTAYTITVTQGIKDLAGYQMASVFTSHFTSLDTLPPPPPPAGAVMSSIPDADGRVTITATQGTAGIHDTVTIINSTRNTSSNVLLNPDGSFSANIQAGIADRLQIKITDPAGNTTIVPVSRFIQTNTDGSVTAAVGPEGGRINGPNDLVFDISEGTFPNGSIVKITSLTESEINVPMTPDFPFVAGFELSSSEEAQRYINVSAPAPTGAASSDPGIVAEVVEILGHKYYSIVDTAKVIDGRLTTSSPPCPGILNKFARYAAFMNNNEQMKLYGTALLSMDIPRNQTFVVPLTPPVDTSSLSGLGAGVGFQGAFGPFIQPYLLYETTYTPFSPFIAKIEGKDPMEGRYEGNECLENAQGVEEILKCAEGGISGRPDVVAPFGGLQSTLRGEQVCLPIPADRPALVRIFDSNTGQTIQNIEVEPTPVGQARDISTQFVDPDDTTPPEIVWSDTSNGIFDGIRRKWIKIQFSEPIAQPVKDDLSIVDSANPGGKIEVNAVVDSHTLWLIPVNPLKMGHRYQIDLEKIMDLNNNHYNGPPVTFSTFKPYVISPGTTDPFNRINREYIAKKLGINPEDLDCYANTGYKSGGVGLMDVDFTTESREEGLNGEWHTKLIGVQSSNCSSGYKVFTFDLSDPVNPVFLNAWNGEGRYYKKVRLLHDFYLEPRDYWRGTFVFDSDGRLIGRSPSYPVPEIDKWRSRELHYDINNPSIRLCAEPGDPRITEWKNKYGQGDVKHGGCGDLAITTSLHGRFGMWLGFLKMFDVTDMDDPDPSKSEPKPIGARLLSEYYPDLTLSLLTSDYPIMPEGMDISSWRPGGAARGCTAPEGMGYPIGFDIIPGMRIPHDMGFENPLTAGAYVANKGIGIELVDIGLNMPQILHEERVPPKFFSEINDCYWWENYEWSFPTMGSKEELALNTGLYYQDISIIRDKVIAIAGDYGGGTGIRTIEVFDPVLSDPLVTPLDQSGSINKEFFPHEMATVTDFPFDPFDKDKDGSTELHDLAFISSLSDGIAVVDITDSGEPQEIGYIRTPPKPASKNLSYLGQTKRHIEIDKEAKIAYVGTGWVDNDEHIFGSIYVIDISPPFDFEFRDKDKDGEDDRILGTIPVTGTDSIHTGTLNGFRLDTKRGLIYAAIDIVDKRLKDDNEIGLVVVKVCECSDIGVDFWAGPEVYTPIPEDVERQALQQVIKNGFDTAQNNCGTSRTYETTMIEQGSGACLWKGGCGPNYQPGISDHDYEVFFPNDIPEDTRKCVIDKLYEQVEDDNGDPKRIDVNGYEVRFDDISFFPMVREEFEEANININPPKTDKGDATGDMGMGRQSLLLKWLLEGAYVEVPGLILKGKDFSEILKILRDPIPMIPNTSPGEPSHILRLEGYEWAKLQESEFYNSGALIRILGSTDSEKTFHHINEKELHKVGKAGIRAVLARIVADDLGNKMAVNTASLYEGAGCIDASSGTDPILWLIVKCDSFEHYVASVAARIAMNIDLRDTDLGRFFSPDNVHNKVYRFYRIKAGLDEITTDEEADKFISMAFNFIQDVIGTTESVYRETIKFDPQMNQREDNLNNVIDRTDKLKAKGKKHIIPRVFNTGPRNIKDVYLRMYDDKQMILSDPSEGKVCIKAASYIHLDHRKEPPVDNKDPLGTCGDVSIQPIPDTDEDDLCAEDIDTCEEPQPSAVPQPVPNQKRKNVNAFSLKGIEQDNPSLSGWISFLLDLPEKKTQELDRENNWAKFYYYVLDKYNPVVPTPTPNKPDLPLDDPSGDMLEPDPVCASIHRLQIVQTVNDSSEVNLRYRGECIAFTIQITNTGNVDLSDVKIYSSLTNKIYPVNRLLVGETQLRADRYCHEAFSGTDFGYVVPTASNTPDGLIIDTNTLVIHPPEAKISLYDNSALSANWQHPFSRYTISHDTMGNKIPVSGAVTDGTERGVKVKIEGLIPGADASVWIEDGEIPSVTDGIGYIEDVLNPSGQQQVTSIIVTADSSGHVELYYTPPSVFVRESHKADDFYKVDRQVKFMVDQPYIGIQTGNLNSSIILNLRRPPVFLVHGLFGTIDVWNDFQPLVPPNTMANRFHVRKGFQLSPTDGMFDLFNVGEYRASESFEKLSKYLIDDIRLSLSEYLPRYVIGKIDIIGHSMGGVLGKKITNDNVEVRNAVRKLITINSPHRGTPLADKIIEIRNQLLPVKFDSNPIDFLSFKRKPPYFDVAEGLWDAIKIDYCMLGIKLASAGLGYNLYDGALDDLRAMSGSAPSPLIDVPTHHVVTNTYHPNLGFSREVTFMWGALGLLCNLTPDERTVDTTKLVQTGGKAVLAILAGGLGSAGVNSGMVSNDIDKLIGFKPISFSSRESLLDTFKEVVGFNFEKLISDVPTVVFNSENDRVVPVSSQLGGLMISDFSVTEVYGKTDHQAAKITKGIKPEECVKTDSNGKPWINRMVRDINNDDQPDVTCRIIELLEADPADPKIDLFKR